MFIVGLICVGIGVTLILFAICSLIINKDK